MSRWLVALSTREAACRTGAVPAATTAPAGNIEERRLGFRRRGSPEETSNNYTAGGAVIIGEGICCQILVVCFLFDDDGRKKAWAEQNGTLICQGQFLSHDGWPQVPTEPDGQGNGLGSSKALFGERVNIIFWHVACSQKIS